MVRLRKSSLRSGLSKARLNTMPPATFRFYAELNDHLPPEQRHVNVTVPIEGRTSVKSILESLNVPAGEVDLVLASGLPVDLDHVVGEGERISVYPVYESFDISGITRVREHPLREPRFVLDCHLGKLAYYLRMLGFDTLYRSDFHDEELIVIASHEQRTLLSRDRALIEERGVSRAYRVGETNPKMQVVEVLKRFDLFTLVRPLQRCLRCNTFLVPIEKSTVLELLPPLVRETYDEFQTCPSCHRVYWKGSHYQRMTGFISAILASAH